MKENIQSPGGARRGIRFGAGATAVAVGAFLGLIGLSSGAVSGIEHETQQVPLNNDEAPVLEACPDDINDYWHFVATPNNGTFSFVSITLDLEGTLTEFSGAGIIPNGEQGDNVFVQVPEGYTHQSIVLDGSFAIITPETPEAGFVLSHLCDGDPPPPTTEPPTTEPPTTEPPTTEPPTTEPPTTPPPPQEPPPTTATPTTVVELTTTSVASEAPTTTALASSGPTTTLAAELPATGATQDALIAAGFALLVLGGVLLMTSRRGKLVS